jgi:hypothetical protein
MILAKPGAAGYPRLLFVRKRQPAAGEIPRYVYLSLQHASRLSDVLVLRTDGINREVYEKGSVVYYLDHGVLREIDTSED